MSRLYINPTVQRLIEDYCKSNSIEDVNAFANRCAMQGLSILKFGSSPQDNIQREKDGVKDYDKKRVKKDIDNEASTNERNVEGCDGKKKGSHNSGAKGEEKGGERKEGDEQERAVVRKIKLLKIS
jgi:hypothetical protein